MAHLTKLSPLVQLLFGKDSLNDGNLLIRRNGLPYIEGVGYLNSLAARDFMGLTDAEHISLVDYVMRCITFFQPLFNAKSSRMADPGFFYKMDYFSLSSVILLVCGRDVDIGHIAASVRRGPDHRTI